MNEFWYLGKECYRIEDATIMAALTDAGIRTEKYAQGVGYIGRNNWYHIDASLDHETQLVLSDGRALCIRGTLVQWATDKNVWEK